MGLRDERRFAGTDEPLVQAVLAEYGELTARHLQAYLPQEEPRSYLYELLADYPAARREDAALEPVHRHGARDRRAVGGRGRRPRCRSS